MVQWVLVEVVRVARRVALALALVLQWQGRSVVVVLCPSIVVVVDGWSIRILSIDPPISQSFSRGSWLIFVFAAFLWRVPRALACGNRSCVWWLLRATRSIEIGNRPKWSWCWNTDDSLLTCFPTWSSVDGRR